MHKSISNPRSVVAWNSFLGIADKVVICLPYMVVIVDEYVYENQRGQKRRGLCVVIGLIKIRMKR